MIHQPIIPPGHYYYGLKFLPPALVHTSPFYGPCAMKLVWHTTEGGGTPGDIRDYLRHKGDNVHIVFDPASGIAAQAIGFDRSAEGLEHPPGTPHTNRVGCIQVEVIGFARDTPKWSEHAYRNLAALALLIEHRTGIRRIADLPFEATGKARRVDPTHWAMAHGHFGHEHAPSQPSGHTDPGALNILRIFRLMFGLEA